VKLLGFLLTSTSLQPAKAMTSRRPALRRRDHHERLALHHITQVDLRADFLRSVEAGLSATPKALPPKFFYDAPGSALFERITALPEYYPTRTEDTILAAHGAEMMAAAWPVAALVELGSGSSTKTRRLLDLLTARAPGATYVPIDISPSIVTKHGRKLLEAYPRLKIEGLVCDYHDAMGALHAWVPTPRLFLFLGSSLGNYAPPEATALLRDVRGAMGAGDRLLLGLDRKKAPEVLHAAYNDVAGVTAAFNLNVLARINRELGGGFDLEAFAHHAFYDEAQGRIEMHLRSLAAQQVPVAALGRTFAFAEGETIHTENSYKYDDALLADLARAAELRPQRAWLDERGWFGLHLLGPA